MGNTIKSFRSAGVGGEIVKEHKIIGTRVEEDERSFSTTSVLERKGIRGTARFSFLVGECGLSRFIDVGTALINNPILFLLNGSRELVPVERKSI